MKQTNEIKFSSYGVWDLLRKVYQNKEELLPKLGFNTYEEFLDWMKTGDQDTQDEFQNIITKHETEKQTTMTEGKLKQLIKEEIKKVLNEGSLRYLKDLEPGKEYQVTVKLKDPYGEKDMDTITISVNQEDIKKDQSIFNYIQDSKYRGTGFTVRGIKSVKEKNI